jgi:hypothetical protein
MCSVYVQLYAPAWLGHWLLEAGRRAVRPTKYCPLYSGRAARVDGAWAKAADPQYTRVPCCLALDHRPNASLACGQDHLAQSLVAPQTLDFTKECKVCDLRDELVQKLHARCIAFA